MITRGEYDSWRRDRLEKEIQQSIFGWIETRFWLITVIALAVGFFGVRALVREMISSELRDATRAAAQADAAAEHTREVTRGVRAEADKYKAEVAVLGDSAVAVRSEMADVHARLLELQARIAAEGGHAIAAADRKVSLLGEEINALRALVTEVATKTDNSVAALDRYREALARTSAVAATETESFEENSKYHVYVVAHGEGMESHDLGVALVRRLNALGFKVAASPWAKGQGQHKVGATEVNYYHASAIEAAKRVASVLEQIVAASPYRIRDVRVKFHDSPTAAEQDIFVFFWM